MDGTVFGAGYMDKCAQYGVHPDALLIITGITDAVLKEAAALDGLARTGKKIGIQAKKVMGNLSGARAAAAEGKHRGAQDRLLKTLGDDPFDATVGTGRRDAMHALTATGRRAELARNSRDLTRAGTGAAGVGAALGVKALAGSKEKQASILRSDQPGYDQHMQGAIGHGALTGAGIGGGAGAGIGLGFGAMAGAERMRALDNTSFVSTLGRGPSTSKYGKVVSLLRAALGATAGGVAGGLTGATAGAAVGGPLGAGYGAAKGQFTSPRG